MIKMLIVNLLLSAAVSGAATQPQQAQPQQVQPQQAQPEPPPSVQLPSELARVLSDYEAAWQARDAAALARLFVEDGFVLPLGRPPVRGRAEIERHYTGKGGPLSLRAFAHATEGSVGYIIGAFAEKKGEPDIGKFTLTLRKEQGGRWLIVSDMDSPSRSPRRP